MLKSNITAIRLLLSKIKTLMWIALLELNVQKLAPGTSYVVKTGDTLQAIAWMYGAESVF